MRHEIDRYKILRDSLRSASATLLSAQAQGSGGPPWDVWQTTPDGMRPTVLWAFQADSGARGIVVHPARLREDSMYDVQSADAGPLGVVSGSVLMEDGVEVVASPGTAAHLILLTPIRQR
jgi:hypothetical protein